MPPTQMRPIRSLLIYTFVVFFGAALAAPWIYWLIQSVAHDSSFAHAPFHRAVNRCLLGLALIGIWPLFRSLGTKSCRDIGLVNPPGEWSRLGAGFLLGFLSLAINAAIVLIAGARHFNSQFTAASLARDLLSAAGTAILVAILEEILFRGAIFGALKRVWNWRFALLISSMIYALVHFMQSADPNGPITWRSGFEVLPRMLRGFGNWNALVPGFFNLTLAGSLLALAYQRTGNLYFSISLHAGWIFWLKSYGRLTVATANPRAWFWGTEKLIDGWLALIVLTFALILLTRLPILRKRPVAR